MVVSTIIQVGFVILTVALLVGEAVPAVRTRFMSYGTRNQPPNSSAQDAKKPKDTVYSAFDSRTGLQRRLDTLASLQVPRNWFKHFYAASVGLSVFWAVQYFLDGHLLDSATRSQDGSLHHSMSIRQVLLGWTLMAFQGARRLYECIAFTKPSSSQMWVGHWILGIVFYFLTSVAVWIEGPRAIRYGELPFESRGLIAPSLKTFIGFPVFAFASGIQFDCHHYLASLQKYSLPRHPMFQILICPHYLAECLIYVALVILTAPQGRVINRTVASALVFVVVNLGITAKKTRAWYAQKFGEQNLVDRYNMIPFVF